MIALLSLRHYRARKLAERIKAEEKRLKILSSESSDKAQSTSKLLVSRNMSQNERKRRAASYQLGHQQQPHILEVILLLFAMFGIPITYIIYKKSANFMRYIRSNDTDLNVTANSTSFIKNHDTVNKNSAYLDDYLEETQSLILNKEFASFQPYSFNFTKSQLRREKNMKKYKHPYSLTSVDRRKSLSLNEFKDVYDGKWPVILSDCVTEWPALNKWNVDYFMEHFGDEAISMVAVDEKYTTRQQVIVKLGTFLDNLETARSNSHFYVQDELFLYTRPQLQADIKTCNVLSENYFNYFPEDIRPWNAFFLWGTRFSRSSLHVDPYNWTGTNAVIRGLKRWKLFPPGQDHLIASGFNYFNKLPLFSTTYSSEIDAFDKASIAAHPQIQNAKVLEFYQYPGEILIIPPGWYHQAFNELPTVAVSGQIMNAANYRIVLEEIFKSNDISRDNYPVSFKKLKPEEQVKQVISRIKKSVLDIGKDNTQNAIKQLKNLQNVLPSSKFYLDIQKKKQLRQRQTSKRPLKKKKNEL